MHLLTDSCDKKPGLWTWSLREEISVWISQRLWGWAHHLRHVLTPPLTDDPMGPLLPPPLHCFKSFQRLPGHWVKNQSPFGDLHNPAYRCPSGALSSRCPCSLAVALQSLHASWTLPWAPSPQCYPGTSRTKVFTSLNNNNFKQPVSARVTPSIFDLFFVL